MHFKRLLSTREVKKWLNAILVSWVLSNFPSASMSWQTYANHEPKILFYNNDIISSSFSFSKSIKSYRDALQWFHYIINLSPYEYDGACWWQKWIIDWFKLYDFAGYVISDVQFYVSVLFFFFVDWYIYFKLCLSKTWKIKLSIKYWQYSSYCVRITFLFFSKIISYWRGCQTVLAIDNIPSFL